MSYTIIEEGIAKAKEIPTWSSVLVEYNHSKHPNEYICYDMNFSSVDLLSTTITGMCDAFLSIVKKYDKKVIDYTGENPKNVVDKLSTNNTVISTCWNFLIEHINNSDDTTNFKHIKANAYVFIGSYTLSDGTSENIYLITRKNPLLTYKKGRTPIFTSQNNTIAKADEPLVQFSKSFDAIVYKNTMYMINNNCESIFNMEYTHKILCKKHLSELEAANIIANFENYDSFASSGQNPKKFITYDASIVEKLTQTKWKNKLAKDLKIPLDSTTKKFDLHEEANARKFTLAICGKTKLNMFDDGICEVPSSTPLII
ncbi:hypothetical protein A500_10505 [Clostridium sartagoforme AAU1]|uniref:Uncharacterized protein n=2 Tax=Clostridiaceae TaxID=31979 RepID=R9CDK5_9CLOT|nr:hypothetical protein A500_10505 [Clostridium sartagoforme AAU1]KLE14428.1 hypothetical protein AAT22_16830 [Clostridium sp. C8]